MKRLFLATSMVCALGVAAHGDRLATAIDEGMWTFDNIPKAQIAQKYKVEIGDDWRGRVQTAIVRLESGCTASFISPEGLLLTNHHCAQSCLAENSTAQRDLVANGYLADTRKDEVRCQGEQASVLMETQDVTADVTQALAGVAAAEAARARNQVLTKLEERCEADAKAAGKPLKCETVTLYQGGQHWLYKYKRYDDVRLAFAPESAAAAFGGDPDNFQFPRWCLDMALLRVYENGKPVRTPNHLKIDFEGPAEGQPTFVSGHPGNTERLLTVSQLEAQRNALIPFWLIRNAELRGRLLQYARTGPEAERQATPLLMNLENAIKVRRKQLDALLDDRLIAERRAEEAKLREYLKQNPELAREVGDPWADIAKSQQVWQNILQRYTFLEGAAGFGNSELFTRARQLVRAAAERQKPNEQRLREYTEARLPALRQTLQAAAPMYPELEKIRLAFGLERMREYLAAYRAAVWRGPAVPVEPLVLVAALRERMTDLAATDADGAFPYLVTADRVRWMRRRLDAAAPRRRPVLAVTLPVVLGEPDERAAARAYLTPYLRTPTYRASWQLQGFSEADWEAPGSDRSHSGTGTSASRPSPARARSTSRIHSSRARYAPKGPSTGSVTPSTGVRSVPATGVSTSSRATSSAPVAARPRRRNASTIR